MSSVPLQFFYFPLLYSHTLLKSKIKSRKIKSKEKFTINT